MKYSNVMVKKRVAAPKCLFHVVTQTKNNDML